VIGGHGSTPAKSSCSIARKTGVIMKLTEQQLAAKVVKWLTEQHWIVYQEVKLGYGGIADIVAVRADLVWVVECKTALTFTVLEQASNWRVHFRSIAVPSVRNRDERAMAYTIAHNYLKLGVIEVGIAVEEYSAPPLMREYHRFAKRYQSLLKEEHKTYCAAGSSNGGQYTPYRATMDHVKRFIMYHPGCTLKQIMDDLGGEHHYASNQGAKTSIRVALSNWEPWCNIIMENGRAHYSIK